MNIGNMSATLSVDARNWGRGLRQAQYVLEDFSSGMDAISSQITNGFYEMAKSGLAFSSMMETQEIAFTNLLNSAAEAKTVLKDLVDLDVNTPFEFGSLAQGTRKLMAFGVQGNKVVPLMHGIADAVAAVGGGAPHIERVTLALGQMYQKGLARGEEMRQLVEAGVNGWDYLAKYLGKTQAEVQDMVQNKQVSAVTFLKAFMHGTSNELGGMSVSMSNTFTGSFEKMRGNAVRILGTVFDPLRKSLTMLFVSMNASGSEGLLTALAPLVTVAAALIDTLAFLIIQFGKLSPATQQWIGYAILAGAVMTVFSAAALSALVTIIGLVGGIAMFVGALVSAGPALVLVIGGLLQVSGGLAAGAAGAFAFTAAVYGMATATGTSFSDVAASASSAAGKMRDAFSDVLAFIKHKVLDVTQVIWNLSSIMRELFHLGAALTIDTTNQSIKRDDREDQYQRNFKEQMAYARETSVGDMLKDVLQGFSLIPKSVTDEVARFDHAMKRFRKKTEGYGDALDDLLESLKGNVTAAREQEAAIADAVRGRVEADNFMSQAIEGFGDEINFIDPVRVATEQRQAAEDFAAQMAAEEEAAMGGLSELHTATEDMAEEARRVANNQSRWSAAMGGLGELGTMMDGIKEAVTEIKDGDKVTGIISLAAIILSRSEGFRQLMSTVMGIVDNIIVVLDPLFIGLSAFLQALMSFPLISEALRIVYGVVKVFGVILMDFAIALNIVWNAIIDAVIWIIKKIIPGAQEDLLAQLEASKTDTQSLRDSRNALADSTWDSATAAAANADATDDATAAMESFSEELLNIPDGFKVAAAQYNAMTAEVLGGGGMNSGSAGASATRPGSGGPTAETGYHGRSSDSNARRGSDRSSAGRQGSPPVGAAALYIENVILQGISNPQQFLAELQKLMERQGVIKTGLPVRLGNRFTTGS